MTLDTDYQSLATAGETLRRYLSETVRFKRRLKLLLPQGYHYQGGEDYVLERGGLATSQALTAEEKALVVRVMEQCPEKRFPVGHCYRNAQVLVACDKSETLHYCEGWAMGLVGIPTLHGWVSINDKVVDLTWRTVKPGRGRMGNRVWGVIPPGWAYYGALFPNNAVRSRIIRLKSTGPFLDDVEHGFPLFKEPRLHALT